MLRVSDVSKVYNIWSEPSSRLYVPAIQKLRKIISSERIQKKLQNREDALVQRFSALKSVNFELRSGESIGIVGRNGSGKSTLLKVITGVLQPTSGTVERSGRIAALLELGSGFDIECSGIENIYLNGTLLGIDKKKIDHDLDRIIEFADIGDFIEQPVKKYSSGMKMRLAFSVTTSLDPDVLIIDEALAVGDDAFRRKCYSRIEELKEKGCSLLFVSHSASTVIQLCDRAILLEAGEQLLTGSPKFVIGHYQRITNASNKERMRIADVIRSGTVELMDETDEDVLPKRSKREKKSFASYDPDLIPKSTIRYETKGAEITNTRIEDKYRRLVNQLQRKERYRFCYEVEFSEVCWNVRFSMLIKNLEGLGIGGLVTHQLGQGIKRIGAGEKLKLIYEFTCNLAPGTYFLNAGVKGFFEENEFFLHRILDANMFRVEIEKDLVVTSFVDFDISYTCIDKS